MREDMVSEEMEDERGRTWRVRKWRMREDLESEEMEDERRHGE